MREFDGLLRSAFERATDAQNPGLALASRLTLAYDALVVELISVVNVLQQQVPTLRIRLA